MRHHEISREEKEKSRRVIDRHHIYVAAKSNQFLLTSTDLFPRKFNPEEVHLRVRARVGRESIQYAKCFVIVIATVTVCPPSRSRARRGLERLRRHFTPSARARCVSSFQPNFSRVKRAAVILHIRDSLRAAHSSGRSVDAPSVGEKGPSVLRIC